MPISIFADGAELPMMEVLARDPRIAGFTTNPTLARRAGVSHYSDFCMSALDVAAGKPVSLEVLADDLPGMLRQAYLLAEMGSNAVVKIPVVTSSGLSTAPIISALAADGVPLNITAVFTPMQVAVVGHALSAGSQAAIVSVFAGRISDAGVEPLAQVHACAVMLRGHCSRASLLWASPRQAYDFTLAQHAGCDIITMAPDLIDKLALRGKDLTDYSRETVAMFHRDAQAAQFELS